MTLARQPQAWMDRIREMIADGDSEGTYLVCFPAYRPELARALADALGYAYLDFRAASLAPLGWRASALPLEAIDQTIAVRAEAGLLLNNAEALLATKSRLERVAWLAGAIERTRGAPVLVSLAVFGVDVPSNSARVCRLLVDDMPPENLLVRLAAQ